MDGEDRTKGPDADATLRFGGSPDRMRVGITRYATASGAGRPLTVELVRESLAAAGVTARMDEARAAEAVRLLLAGQDAGTIVIARGLKPEEPADAWVELAGAPGLPVFPGQAVGVLHPAVPGREGRDVAGAPVPPQETRVPRAIAPGAGLGLDRDGALSAQVAGVPRLREGVVALEPLFRISPDRLTVTARLYPRDAQGREVTVEGIQLALASQGVRHGLQAEALAEALERAKASGCPVDGVLAAQGQAAVHGENGRLELLVGQESSREPESENARHDYHLRNVFRVAEPGQDIARLRPPGKGRPGRDVLGAELPARDGTPLRLKPGKYVEALEGGTLFRARIGGVLLTAAGALDVSELLTIPGDVDFGTGNVELAHGSVRVGGTVRTGFSVSVPGSVLVEGMVESASVLAGGDVAVRGGIFMSGDEAARVEAGGSVTADFTHNAQVKAGGDITVAKSMVGSKATSGSRITSGGFVRVLDQRGRIMGGTVVCGAGLEVFEAGSERGMTTTLVVNVETPEAAGLVQEMRELKALRQKALFVLGEGDGTSALARLSAAHRAEAEELLGRREGIEARLGQIQRSLAELAREHMERVKNARIIVRGTAYPGVAIKMGGKALYVEQPMSACAFSWDIQAGEIVVGAP